jgi:hypothetical protein
LFTLEADPPKASSDPGYYGREYAFKGDAVVENQNVLAVLENATGRLTLYSSIDGAKDGSGPTSPVKVLELSANLPKEDSGGAVKVEILRNGEDEVVLRIVFLSVPQCAVVFGFDRTRIVDVRPSGRLKHFSLSAPLEQVVIPSFIGDDLIYGAQGKESGDHLSLPSENLLVGLLRGEATEWVMTWPKGNQRVELRLGAETSGHRLLESVEFENGEQPFYLAALAAPGIWHEEALSAAFLEKDKAIDWKKPFPARWKTQLLEEGLKTSFAFRDSPGEIWRGVAGSYNYPVWFDGDQAFYHLSKKVQPRGESLIYFLEGQGTPASVLTPAEMVKSTLGRPMSDAILDVEGRKLRTHHRRGGEGVHRACTCGCTEAIQAVFEAGEEVSHKEDIKGDLEDMVYFVHRHVERIEEYQRFAEEMVRYLETNKSKAPELSEYLEGLEQTVRQIPQECTVQKENMKSFAFADDLVRRTLALTEKKDPENLKSYMELLKEWRAMGGAQDYVVAQCHNITRKLAQEAGYGCAGRPEAVILAEEIRTRARLCLRNPDGYEIWGDY